MVSTDIYHAIEREEFEDKKIVTSKKWRTIWKNELYFQLVKYYCPKLNLYKEYERVLSADG